MAEERAAAGGSVPGNPRMMAEHAAVGGAVTGDATAEPGDVPLTGDARVDAAIEGLRRLAGTPPAEHVAVLEEAHGRLRDILGELAEDQP